jgi:hypothetical protein
MGHGPAKTPQSHGNAEVDFQNCQERKMNFSKLGKKWPLEILD